MKTIVTHNGTFHPDDVFATATLQLHYGVENLKIIRSRDPEIIKSADIVYDVGLTYEPATERYDHHQEGAPVRGNGVPYAAFGLVWKHYGEKLCGSKEVQETIDQKFVQPIDAEDNGVTICIAADERVTPIDFQDLVFVFLPSWDSADTYDQKFLQAVDWARGVLERLIEKEQDLHQMRQYIQQVYESTPEKDILVFDKRVLCDALIKYGNVKMAVYPNGLGSAWYAEAVKIKPRTFEYHGVFPDAWLGLQGEALQNVTGLPDAHFAHKKKFFFAAGSKESALKAAKVALGI